jgi:hypothetical protein
MTHGFVCLCLDCTRAARPLKLAAMDQWAAAVTEAQRERRAYSWHSPYWVAA